MATKTKSDAPERESEALSDEDMLETESSSGHSYTHIKKETFLKAFREKGTTKHSYEAAGVCRQTIYNWLADDEVFKRDFADAKEDFGDDLEQELYTRVKSNTIKNKSDLALFCALKGNRREKFGDNIIVTPLESLITFKVMRIEVVEPPLLPEGRE